MLVKKISKIKNIHKVIALFEFEVNGAFGQTL